MLTIATRLSMDSLRERWWAWHVWGVVPSGCWCVVGVRVCECVVGVRLAGSEWAGEGEKEWIGGKGTGSRCGKIVTGRCYQQYSQNTSPIFVTLRSNLPELKTYCSKDFWSSVYIWTADEIAWYTRFTLRSYLQLQYITVQQETQFGLINCPFWLERQQWR